MTEPAESTCILVIGMHRSGTSVTTGVVARLLGVEVDQLKQSSNPRGQYELRNMRHHLDALLLANRSSWRHPPATPITDGLSAFNKLAKRAAIKLQAERTVWKDPRLCLTLPFWLSVLPSDPLIVFCTRHPEDVAESLLRRDGTALDVGRALWERTNRRALEALEGRQVFAVPFEALTRDPGQVVGDLNDWIAQSTGRRPARDAVSDAVGLVATSNAPPAEPSSGGLSDQQTELWTLMKSLSAVETIERLAIAETPSTESVLGQMPLGEYWVAWARTIRRYLFPGAAW